MILETFQLKGKNALVTGSSRGLGAAIALALAEAGANVALHGSSSVPARLVESITKTGARYLVLTGDLRQQELCPVLVEQTIAGLGGIDILVNNAGTIRRSPAVDFSMTDWMEVLQTNLTSVFQLSQAAGRHMLKQGSGKIINIASLLSFQGGVTVPSYAAAKGGVAQLTKALANEWASKGVQVNAIAPGYMETDNTKALRDDQNRSRQILERIPAGRWGSPQDVAGAAVFLASAASNYINGHILAVDGGWLGR
ncbi:MAG: 2-dehydro-3-deoxy-D-gluconate 5-dehydrogenase KduD [Acidobacteria bacterium]|nr:2-dehydro-3-deoxy-D-gluconate 5-dehydrogenase KduD [Acidobacteriota bacterium]MBW4044891.1 2-dehydro-3-deoxy-D-gluconate 5-dehydrogenase KduD [Acidobacteriota bacterium]